MLMIIIPESELQAEKLNIWGKVENFMVNWHCSLVSSAGSWSAVAYHSSIPVLKVHVIRVYRSITRLSFLEFICFFFVYNYCKLLVYIVIPLIPSNYTSDHCTLFSLKLKKYHQLILCKPLKCVNV